MRLRNAKLKQGEDLTQLAQLVDLCACKGSISAADRRHVAAIAAWIAYWKSHPGELDNDSVAFIRYQACEMLAAGMFNRHLLSTRLN